MRRFTQVRFSRRSVSALAKALLLVGFVTLGGGHSGTALTPAGGVNVGDFEERLNLFGFDPPPDGDKVLQSLNQPIGPGLELDETIHEVQNPQFWGDALNVDIDPDALTLTLSTTSSNCFGYIDVIITNLTLAALPDGISGLELIQDEAFSNSGDPDFSRTVTTTRNSIQIRYEFDETVNTCGLDLGATGSSDVYAIEGGFSNLTNGADVLVVSDQDTDSNITDVLVDDGHFVTEVLFDWNAGVNTFLQGDLDPFDVIVWSASGDTGGVHESATTNNLFVWANQGGRLLVTGIDSLTDPDDPELIELLGGTSAAVEGPVETFFIDQSNNLTFGRTIVEVRDLRATLLDVDPARSALAGLGTGTLGVLPATSPGAFFWTLRALGTGELAFVSNGDAGSVTPSWEAGPYNAGLRNFVDGGTVLQDLSRAGLPAPVGNQAGVAIPFVVTDDLDSIVVDMNVALDLRGDTPDTPIPWDELELSLTKNATTVALRMAPDETETGLFKVLFDDEADTALADATGNAVGRFSPDEPLSAFDGETLAGTWTLDISNVCCDRTISLEEWRLSARVIVDSDGDGVRDPDDDLPLDPTETVDTDGDGVGDNSDAFPDDPTETSDGDADGTGDNGDNCPMDSNPGQEDVDEDGFGDVCDNAPNDFNPDQRDGDADGVGDVGDNCPTIPNADQADTFATEAGDFCEGLGPASVLFVADGAENQEIVSVLQGDGHTVSSVILDFSNGANTTLLGDLSAYDVIYWSASGAGSGIPHDPATFENLESYVSGGGRIFVTGPNALTQAAPFDEALVAFLGGSSVAASSSDVTTLLNVSSVLAVGQIDARGVSLTGVLARDLDLLGGLGANTQPVDDSDGDRFGYAVTLRLLGLGRIAWVSSDVNNDGAPDSWSQDPFYNALVRNYVIKFPDFDGDGVPNPLDAFPDDPTETADFDDDGTGNNSDNCPATPNPDQFDIDDDGFGDACDNCPEDDNPGQGDVDGDMVGNLCDNCVDDPNPGQENFDFDALGNACDPDVDGDGELNGVDLDVDGDGLFNAFDPDVDGDGLLNEEDPDADGDGIPNEEDPTPIPEPTAFALGLAALCGVLGLRGRARRRRRS